MIESDGVYIYNVQQLENGGVAKGIVGNHARLTLTVTDNIVTAAYIDYLGTPIVNESRPIEISITGAVTQELTLTPVDGKATFNMPTAGCVIRARADFPCDMAELRT